MKEIITSGKSLEEIREKCAMEWSCLPAQLIIEVIEKPGVFHRNWKVKVILTGDAFEATIPEDTCVSWDEVKYKIIPGKSVETIVPFPLAGKLFCEGEEITDEYRFQRGDRFEFYPMQRQGGLSWNIQVVDDKSKAVARVRHEHSGRYVLTEDIPKASRLVLERFITWESAPDTGEFKTEDDLKKELGEKGIICGIKPNIWIEFLTVDGIEQICVAQSTKPVQSIQPELIDYVGDSVSDEEENIDKIDFFASKLRTCQKDEVLAKKIPGKEGTPGLDIFGNIIPVEKMKDFNFKLKKNVYLSEDGLTVLASCPGTPLRINQYTYLVENSYLLNKNVDLETGSIDFPGDVNIGGNVTDGFYVYSGGKIRVQGSVSNATLKAEAGLVVKNNIIASKIIVGEKHVFRFGFVKGLHEINEELGLCIIQVEQLQNVSGNPNVGQLLKIILEKNFPQLPKKSEEVENLLIYSDPEFVSQELEVAVRTLKRFLVGLGPLQLNNLIYLKNCLKIINYFLETKGELIPASVDCDTNYVQNSEISCAGDFLCKKGVYNSTIKVEGNIKIHGVYRGGEIRCSGDLYIWELGGSNISATIVRAAKNSRLHIEYCHPNIKIFVGKELIRIDEGAQKLEIYRERSVLQIEKLKWDGKN